MTSQEAEEAPGASHVTQAAWLKRLSTFSSNEGSISSSPRPPSTAVSQSNGSVAFSNAGSTTPMFPSFSPAQIPPNKLVKRSSSIKDRDTKANSRIPIPTFKRPATSHQRDATLQELQRRPSTATSSFLPSDSPNPEPTGVTWKSYFTPKITLENSGTSSRRNSTSIPNPIKRIQPDRKYYPMLVSSAEVIRPAALDIEQSEQELPPSFSLNRGSLRGARRFFSSPLPQRPSTASSRTSISMSQPSRAGDTRLSSSGGEASNRNSLLSQGQSEPSKSSPLLSVNRRSFSPAGLIPTELPKWKRPSKSKTADPASRRKGLRSVSGPEPRRASQQAASADPERPSKRRDVSGLSRRSSVQSRDGPGKSPKVPLNEAPSTKPITTGQTKTLQAFATEDTSSQRFSWVETSSPYPDNYHVSSPAGGSTKSRPSRQSATMSEFASNFTGSDSDAHNVDDDGFESPNDTLFDSVRTRATSASSTGFKGPRIDTIFDESRNQSEGSPSSLDHLYQGTKFSSTFDRPRHSVIEEEESVSTPVRSHHNGSAKQSPETFRFGSSPVHLMNSSPPEIPSIFRRQPSAEIGLGIDEDDGMWDFGDEPNKFYAYPLNGSVGQASNGGLGGPMLHPNLRTSGLQATPHKNFSDQTDARSNIFDWSEQQHADKSPAGRSPPRPRTVHGKKDAETRGSRSAGRRAPSALHIRSQSVPVAPEADSKRSQVVTNKFGTWGVGSKGVTEDWNEDFDFEEAAPPVPAVPAAHQAESIQREVSGGMHVPQAIQQQQQNVLANINLLRDWGLLIEELKDLRAKAVTLNLIDELKDAMWHEVDAMVDLADQESNDHTLAPRQSPPSSPTFDYSAFDEPAPSMPLRTSPRPPPKMHAEDIFESPTPSPARKTAEVVDNSSVRRPRKDSEAVARSVIEALQQRRNISDPTTSSTAASKKVPFDTATLRRIVPYVQELRDRVKRTIREAEDLYSSPRQKQVRGDPTFSQIFQEPPDSPSVHRSRKRSHQNDHVSSGASASHSPPDDLSRRMELMTMG
ncbi:hypothetical protein CAC42_7855 [Sphaceloma murrayae]|uniref:Uncharacterized protein n=1 Tax=Sphaceloma murrayae TaxID=2082308 RepID=A0A2K1QXV1_9PEZI|nr:hypothetical protein CAC42_7855 [Sphaceloma murrayae]